MTDMPLIFSNPAHSGIQDDLKRRLELAAEVYGWPLTITSGLDDRPNTPGSMHPHGGASDLSMAGMDDAARMRLATILREQGVRRFGTYGNNPDMLHVDMSNAQGGNWYMHDKTNRNMANAPEWFRTFAGTPGADVRQASAVSGVSTDTDRPPSGDPATGRGYHQGTPVQGAHRAMTPGPGGGGGQLPPLPPLAYQESKMDDAPALSPLVSLLLGAAMGTGGLGSRLASGASLAGSAIASSQAAENDLYALKMKRSEAARKAAQSDALAKWGQQVQTVPGMEDIGTLMQIDPAAGTRLYVERQKQQQEAAQREQYAAMMEQQGRPEIAAQIRAGGNLGAIDTTPPAAPTYGVTPNYIRRGDKVFERRLSSDGTAIEVPVEGTPFSIEQRLPEFRENVAAGEARGKSRGAAEESTRTGMESLGAMYDAVMELLPQATGSGLGAARDIALGSVGLHTEAGKAAESLKIYGAKLVQAVPRMEGPQSDKDVQLYREAAGRIGDPTVPNEYRMESMQTLLEIARRQQALGNPAFADVRLPNGAAAAPRVLPRGVVIEEVK